MIEVRLTDDDVVAVFFSEDTAVEADEVCPGVVVHYDAEDKIVSIEVLRHYLAGEECE